MRIEWLELLETPTLARTQSIEPAKPENKVLTTEDRVQP